MTDNEKKDKILGYLLKKDHQCSPAEISKYLFNRNNYDEELIYETISLLKQMNSTNPEVATFNLVPDSESISKNENTQLFFEHGGFVAQNNENKKERINKKRDYILTKWKLITFWPIFIFGLLGGLFSIYNFKKDIEVKENLKELEQTIDILKSEITNSNTINKVQGTDTTSAIHPVLDNNH